MKGIFVLVRSLFCPAVMHSGTVVYFSNVLTLGVGQRSLVEEELKQLSVSMAFEGGQHRDSMTERVSICFHPNKEETLKKCRKLGCFCFPWWSFGIFVQFKGLGAI